MRKTSGVFGTRHWKFIAICAFAFNAACGADELTWTEEIVLPDGGKLTLNRRTEFGGRYEPGQSPTISLNAFEFTEPTERVKIRYEGTNAFRTVALLRDRQTFYLVLSYGVGTGDHDDGCPEPPIVILQYGDGVWKRIPFAQSPIKRIHTNMIRDPKASREFISSKRHSLSAEDIRADVASHIRIQDSYDISGLSEPTLKCPNMKKK